MSPWIFRPSYGLGYVIFGCLLLFSTASPVERSRIVETSLYDRTDPLPLPWNRVNLSALMSHPFHRPLAVVDTHMIVMTIEREWQDGIRFQKNVDKMQSTIYVDLISLGL